MFTNDALSTKSLKLQNTLIFNDIGNQPTKINTIKFPTSFNSGFLTLHQVRSDPLLQNNVCINRMKHKIKRKFIDSNIQHSEFNVTY